MSASKRRQATRLVFVVRPPPEASAFGGRNSVLRAVQASSTEAALVAAKVEKALAAAQHSLHENLAELEKARDALIASQSQVHMPQLLRLQNAQLFRLR